MPKARTHFKQVPIKTVMRIIDEELKREGAAEPAEVSTKKILKNALLAAKAQ